MILMVLFGFYALVPVTHQNMLQTGLIVGGWDKYEGGKVYGVPLGGTIVEQPFAIGGIFCLNLCHGNYHSLCLRIDCRIPVLDFVPS